MRYLWEWIIKADLFCAVVFALSAIYGWIRHRKAPKPNHSRMLTVGRKSVIVGFLAGLIVVLVSTGFLYAFAYPPGSFECMALPAVLEYGAFGFPCLAGIVAGLGFVYKKSQTEISRSLDLRFYMGSAVILIFGLIVYIADHRRPLVIVSLSLSVAIACVIALWIAMGLRVSWRSDPQPEALPIKPCCESHHAGGNGPDTEPQREDRAIKDRALVSTDPLPQDRGARNNHLNDGAPIGSTTFGIIFAALLVFQLLTLLATVAGPDIHLRTLKQDAQEKEKCAAEDKAESG